MFIRKSLLKKQPALDQPRILRRLRKINREMQIRSTTGSIHSQGHLGTRTGWAPPAGLISPPPHSPRMSLNIVFLLPLLRSRADTGTEIWNFYSCLKRKTTFKPKVRRMSLKLRRCLQPRSPPQSPDSAKYPGEMKEQGLG